MPRVAEPSRARQHYVPLRPLDGEIGDLFPSLLCRHQVRTPGELLDLRARSEVVRVRASDYVEAAFGSGGTLIRVLLRHILPNSLTSVTVFDV